MFVRIFLRQKVGMNYFTRSYTEVRLFFGKERRGFEGIFVHAEKFRFAGGGTFGRGAVALCVGDGGLQRQRDGGKPEEDPNLLRRSGGKGGQPFL